MSHPRLSGRTGAVAVAVVAIAAAAVAYAQTTVIPIPETPPVETAPLMLVPEVTTWGDAEAGAVKAGTCAACHGLDGNSPDPQYPRLAGQSERYIAQQIALFKSGARNTGMAAIMMPFAQMLSPQDARDIGAYYATQTSGAGVADDTVIAEGPYAGMKYYEAGEKLYRGGDQERGIPACLACHGPDGSGNPGPAYPHVAGQFAAYTQRRLEDYRAGTTSEAKPGLYDVMAAVAKPLTDEEIGALASYLQGLHPRSADLAVAGVPVGMTPAMPAPVPALPEAVDGPAEPTGPAGDAVDEDAAAAATDS
ncbi:MAG: cytochrome c4 [Pseudomonadota bacterium]|nr:cytochrome c4 [Pseudomonadota bacterium]